MAAALEGAEVAKSAEEKEEEVEEPDYLAIGKEAWETKWYP